MSLTPTFIQQMYVAYFGRPADPGGLAFYANFTEASLVQGFSASPESQALYGGSNSLAAIDAVYQNLFNRAAEPAGLVAWNALLVAGKINLANMALSILRGAANDDLVAVTNKVAAAAVFTSHLDTSDEMAGYAGNAAAATARSFLKAVGSSQDSLNTARNDVDKAVTLVVTPVPRTVGTALTAAVDNIVGTSGDDSFTSGSAGYFNFGDSINGGDGSDTLTVTGETAAITGSGITVASVETASLSTSGSINLDTSGWTGLASLTAMGSGSYVLKTTAGTNTTANASGVGFQQVVVDGGANVTVNATGVSGGSVTVGSNTAPTGALVVNASGFVNSVFAKGGTSVVVNATGSSSITATGAAATTAVTLNAASGSTLNVIDVNANTSTAGTITSVTANGFGSLNINDNALSNLTVTNATGNVTINNGGGSNHTLNLTVDLGSNLTSHIPTVTDANVYTTINLSGVGSNFSYVGSLFGGAVTSLNIGGAASLDFTLPATDNLSGLRTFTMGGSGKVFIQFTSQNTALTLIDTTGNTGTSSIGFNAAQTKYVGGAGSDSVYFTSSAMGQDIDLGDGDDALTLPGGITTLASTIKGGNGNDTLTINAADATAITSAGTSLTNKVSGFEILNLESAVGTQAVDLALFGAINQVNLGLANSANMTFNHFLSGGTLNIFDSVAGVTLNGDFSGTNDTLNLQAVTLFSNNFTTTMPIKASGIENIFIRAQSASPLPNYHNIVAVNLQDTAAKAITITNVIDSNPGVVTVALTTDSTALTSVDASGMPTGSLAWTSGALANAAVVKGSAQGNDVINMAADANAITITVGSGANTISVGSGVDRVNITGVNAASATNFTTITGLTDGSGDTVSVGGSVNAMGSQVSDLHTSLLADLNAAAAGNASSASPVLHWFNFGGDTYLVKDVSAGSGFVSGADMVVKLAGTLDLGAATVVAGLITL
jgi:S-layer protein